MKGTPTPNDGTPTEMNGTPPQKNGTPKHIMFKHVFIKANKTKKSP